MAPAKTHTGINMHTKIVDHILFNKDYLNLNLNLNPVRVFQALNRLRFPL